MPHCALVNCFLISQGFVLLFCLSSYHKFVAEACDLFANLGVALLDSDNDAYVYDMYDMIKSTDQNITTRDRSAWLSHILCFCD